jgi:hypothetical protein
MATANLDNSLSRWPIIDKRATPIAGTGTSPVSAATYNALKDNQTTDAALVTANAAYWTQARLDATCLTDKIYALRLINDAAGIS